MFANAGQIRIGSNSIKDVTIGNYSLGRFANAAEKNWQEEIDRAVGYTREPRGTNAAAFGNGATARGKFSTALGVDSRAGNYSTAIGQAANASGENSTALGHKANATGVRAIAIGDGVTAGANQIRIGNSSISDVEIGKYDLSEFQTISQSLPFFQDAKNGSLAIGQNASVFGYNSTAVGIGARANSRSYYDDNIEREVSASGTAFGYGANASFGGTAIGSESFAEEGGTAIGFSAQATAVKAIAIGAHSGFLTFYDENLGIHRASGAYAEDAIAIGSFSYATANGAIALGGGASAMGMNSIAIGRNMFANAGQIRIGDSSIGDVTVGAFNLSEFSDKETVSSINSALLMADDTLRAQIEGVNSSRGTAVRAIIEEETEEGRIINNAIHTAINSTDFSFILPSATGTEATTFGEGGADGVGNNSSTFGWGAYAGPGAVNSSAFGHSANATSPQSVAIGAGASTVPETNLPNFNSEGAIAIGVGAHAVGLGAIAIGHNVKAKVATSGVGQIRIGNTNQSDVQIGIYDLQHFARRVGYDPATAHGTSSPPRPPDPPRPPIQSEVDDASVQGAEARAESPVATAGIQTSSGSINGGDRSRADGTESTALGYNASVTLSGGTAIGANASVTIRGGISIGAGVRTESGNSIVIGERDETGVRIGRYSLQEMDDRIGTIGDDPNPTGSAHARINDHETRLSSVESRVSGLVDVSNRLSKAVAMSMAQEFIAVEKDRRARFGMTSSAYRGEFGIGASAGVRLNDMIQFHFSGAMDSGFDEKAIKAGFDIQFGGKQQ